MCAQPLTLDAIKPYLSNAAHQKLSEVDGPVLAKVFSPAGASIKVGKKDCNVSIEWHTKQSGDISGIFFRIYSGDHLEAYLFTSKGLEYSEISIVSGHTEIKKTAGIMDQDAGKLFGKCAGAKHAEAIQLQVQHLQHPEQIKAFFEKHQGMIPEPLRAQIFTKEKEDPAQEPECCSRTYYYIGGALLLTLGTLFVVKKYFPKYDPIKYVQLPYSLAWIPENLRRIAKA